MYGLSTLFPPVMQTLWLVDDPALELHDGAWAGDRWRSSGSAGWVVGGPHIRLGPGLYGVEYQLRRRVTGLDPAAVIARVQVTAGGGSAVLLDAPVQAAETERNFTGMYQGVRPTLRVDGDQTDVEFRVLATGVCPVEVLGIKLIPRPGQTWFPADLRIDPTHWTLNTDGSATSLQATLLGGPGIGLGPGEYRLGVKLQGPPDLSGPVAEIEVVGRSGGERRTLDPAQSVLAEDMRAYFGIREAKGRFRLEADHHNVQVRTRALMPGVRVEWVRIATADEAVWHHYYNLGGMHSSLGLPTGPFALLRSDAAEGLAPVSLSARQFEGGMIYWTLDNGPVQVVGPIYDLYDSMGGPDGTLGLPVSRPRTVDSASGGEDTLQDFRRDGVTRTVVETVDGSGGRMAFVTRSEA